MSSFQTAELLRHKAEAVEPARRAVYLHSLGQSYERLGDHGQEGAYTTALNLYQEALKLLDAEKDPRSYATVLRRIGDICKAQGNLHDAHSACSRAVELLRRSDGTQQQGLASALIDLGRICREISMHEE